MRPLPVKEWLKENYPHPHDGFVIPSVEMVEEYASYYHSELSRPPKDVVDAIELAAGESVRFAEWINKGRFDFTGKEEWINLDTKEVLTTSQLHELFKKESNG